MNKENLLLQELGIVKQLLVEMITLWTMIIYWRIIHLPMAHHLVLKNNHKFTIF